MDSSYATFSFENGTTTVIVNPNIEGEYLFQEGNMAAEMLMAVCQESNFGIPIRIDLRDDAVNLEQGEEKTEVEIQTLDLNSNDSDPAPEELPQQIEVPNQQKLNVTKGGVRKRRSRPSDPYYDLLTQIRRDTNRAHLVFQKQGAKICCLLSDLIETIKK